MNLDALKDQLVTDGFRIQPQSRDGSPWLACRRSAHDARTCECNDDKPGIQLTVVPYEMTLNGEIWQSAEVDVTGEYGGNWYSLKCYSMKPEQVASEIAKVEAALIRAWNGLEG